MTSKPDIGTKDKVEDEQPQPPITSPEQPTPNIYPELSPKLKGALIWLGLGFIVLVFVVQQFSGYN
jgi:hypothetical protein